ncbi:pyridoxal-phosphate dependent enzyme [Marinimicrococcus flavescens]|uniref:Pyridoxal-phosphate dependent enzyme n=1 Tax=Marinimicrococcus flavescens TaxID=3031815 RepID=A0AAP3XQF1_9PROT|nr:pyridoxal-phosphate dependent enzyme [Marinimicrococcus flavescens]
MDPSSIPAFLRPRVRLLDADTPLERMRRVEAAVGHDGLWVKRDDCMPLGLGGNKLRSLEFWMGEALEQGADIVLVAGQPASNQCRLTAAAAAKLGLDCLVLHNADEPQRDEGNLLLSRLMGASLRFLGPVDEDERARRVREAAEELRRQGRRPYIVGEPVTGALGYVVAALELHGQAERAGADLRHVVLPGSMGPTEAGFLFGCALLGRPFEVHLVSVEYAVPELLERITRIFEGLVARTGMAPAGDWREWTLAHDNQLGAGYAVPTEEALAALRTFARLEGLFLETTYTGKTFAGLLRLVRDGIIPASEAACCLHTGGVPALFAQPGAAEAGRS